MRNFGRIITGALVLCSTASLGRAQPVRHVATIPVKVAFSIPGAELTQSDADPVRVWLFAGKSYPWKVAAQRKDDFRFGPLMTLEFAAPPEAAVSGATAWTGVDQNRDLSGQIRFDKPGVYEVEGGAKVEPSGFVNRLRIRVTVVGSAAALVKARLDNDRAASDASLLSAADIRASIDAAPRNAPAGTAHIYGVAATYPFADGRRYPLRGIEMELWEQGGAKLAGPLHTAEPSPLPGCGLDKTANYVDGAGAWVHSNNAGAFDFGNVGVGTGKTVYFKLRYRFFAGGDGATAAGVMKLEIQDAATAGSPVIEFNSAPFTAASAAEIQKVVYGADLGTPGTLSDEATHAFHDVSVTYGYFRDCAGFVNEYVTAQIDLTNTSAPYSNGTSLYLSAWDIPYLPYELSSVIIHEYAHTIHFNMRGGSWPEMPASDSNHGGCSNTTSADAVTEGWAQFLPLRMFNSPIERWSAGSSFDLGSESNTSNCDRDEWTVAGIWWDLLTESGLTLDVTMNQISNTLETRDPNYVYDYYLNFISSWGRCAGTDTIFRNHNVTYPDSCALGVIAAVSPAPSAAVPTGVVPLSWSSIAGATAYDVYLGSTLPPPLVATRAVNNYSTASLPTGRYYWKVVARGGSGTAYSPLWVLDVVPSAPTAPSPADGATGVSRTASLSWSGAAGSSCNQVYFGAVNPPPYIACYIGNNYYPGTMPAGTTHYWRVIATSDGGNSPSPLWSFRTLGGELPGTPTNLKPADNTANLPAAVTLNWSAGTATNSYDVLLSTANPPTLYTSTADPSLKVSGLTPGARYYWQVVARNGNGSTATSVLTFTTQPRYPSRVGVYESGSWYLDVDGNGFFGPPDKALGWGSATMLPVTGDWNGDGKAEVGVYDHGVWYLDMDGNGVWSAGDKAFMWGWPNSTPVVGDWNGDGKSEWGVFDNGNWYLDVNGSTFMDVGDLAFGWGDVVSVPVVGDWNGDGRAKAGIYKAGVWYLDKNGSGVWDAGDLAFGWGDATSLPLVGDWNGDGRAKVGAVISGTWYLDVDGSTGWSAGDRAFPWGKSSSIPVVGDWNGDGKAKAGCYTGGIWRLDVNGNSVFDAADKEFQWGLNGDKLVAGKW